MSLSTETLFHFFVATMSYGKFIVSSLHNNPWNCSRLVEIILTETSEVSSSLFLSC